jgi:hypothetical protein
MMRLYCGYRCFQQASLHAAASFPAGEESQVDGTLLHCMLLLSAGILRLGQCQRRLHGVKEDSRRRSSCGLVGLSGGGGGGRDGAFAVFEGHLVAVSLALLTWKSMDTYHSVEGLLGSARVFAVLEDHLSVISEAL